MTKITINILAVLDGTLTFDIDSNADDLGLALSQIKDDNHLKFNIVKKNRLDKPFKNLNHYDQIWLFGQKSVNGSQLSQKEITAITEFMSKGGGVFATGDHEKIGIALGGSIPKVRAMRSWSSNLQIETSQRYPTLPLPTKAPFQYDTHPKLIRPCLKPTANGYAPHFILRMPDNSPIVFLPDHDHEGSCTESDEINATKEGFNSKHLPFIIADTFSYKNTLPDIPQRAKPYGVVSVYDPPDNCPDGRIVVDSTFHHWTYRNITGFSENSGNSTLVDTIWHQIQQYYNNIAMWLIPKSIRNLLLPKMIEHIRLATSIDNEMLGIDISNSSTKSHIGNDLLTSMESRFNTALIDELVHERLTLSTEENEKKNSEKIQEAIIKLSKDNCAIARGVHQTIKEEVIASIYFELLGIDCDEAPIQCAIERIEKALKNIA